MCLTFLVAFATFASGPPVFGIPDAISNIESNHRLPGDVLPLAYNLTITPYLNEEDGDKRFNFDGEVFIDIKSKEVNQIVMHSKNLNYSLMEYWDKDELHNKRSFKSFSTNNITDKFLLDLNEKLIASKIYTLHFVYMGQMVDDMHGFCRGSYDDDQNNTKWIAYTHLQQNHARKVFPCFDEPKFKATFNLTIIRHHSYNSVSNSRKISSKQMSENSYADIYQQTPIMSTYTLAILVSQFQERGNNEFYVIARPEHYSQTNYSFEIGQKLLNELNQYMPISYHGMGINKMHIAAVPNFAPKGMENWGLVMFREDSVLVEPGVTSLATQQEITTYIAHELAHMWFGNLVTCEWWGYMWLNEGFTNYFQYMMTAKIFPEWNLDHQFIDVEMRGALQMDATNSTKPLSNHTTLKAHDFSDFTSNYYIIYSKSSSIIRMVRHAMGEKAFHKSLKDYLTEFKYKSTIPENLLLHWKNNWPKDFKMYAEGVFKSFTDQVGYPLVKVNVSIDGKSMELSQKRFLLNSEDGSDNNLLYTIPFTYTTSNRPDFETTIPKLYLEAVTNVTTVNLPGVDWVIANIQESGFYRINYDPKTWLSIKKALMARNWSNIHPTNRAQFVDDLFNLAAAGEIKYNLALECLQYLETETNILPWAAAVSGYRELINWLKVSKIDNFGRYIVKQTEKVFKFIGLNGKENDTALDTSTGSYIRSWACMFGNIDCIFEAMKNFNAMNLSLVSEDFAILVYCTVIKEGHEEQFYQLLNKYKLETKSNHRSILLQSLGCLKNNEMIKKYFDIIKSNEFQNLERHRAIKFLTWTYEENADIVFQLVVENFEILANLTSYDAIATTIKHVAYSLNSVSQKNALEEFINQHIDKFGESGLILKAAVYDVAYNLIKEIPKHVKEFLRHFTKPENKAIANYD